MAYFLHHHFNPDFDHSRLSPQSLAGGGVDHHKLGYVQNVGEGDVLAAWEEIPSGDDSRFDPRFVYAEKIFPVGRNCRVDPKNPDRLLAGADGYVFYLDGTINVKKVLNVRGDVDYHTGNIRFVGDMIIHGRIRSGFEVRAGNIRVLGNVNGAKVRATGSLQVDGGIKGSKNADIRAQGTIRARFVEHAVLRAGRDILIDGACTHCDLFAPRRIAIKGRFQGGTVYSQGIVYVRERVGCGMGGRTNLVLGFDSGLLRGADLLMTRIKRSRTLLDRTRGEKTGEGQDPSAQERLQQRLDSLKARQRKVWEVIGTTFNEASRLLVPGTILPGVDISIGPAHLRIEEPLQDVGFFFKDNELCRFSPALKG
ncbi:FapA family protein [Desulfoplanes sp.]